ncbi:Transglutaminase-like superfamily protein [compost metagenome]
MIDADIPHHIELAAAEITQGAGTDEEKARKLYDWIGSRVSYDYGKVEDYEERGIWHEQTPKDTFDTKKGVCIDYSRLYAAMARSQGLQVKVVTGLGYDGQGGYGPHAWNEVYLSEQDKWIPLDSTWAKSGDWFNPPAFAETHVPDTIV